MTPPTDAASWQALEARLRPFVARRVASSADADDVMQDVLLRVSRGLGRVEDEERLTAWLFRVARSAVADHLRARARHPVPASHRLGDDPHLDEPSEPVGALEEGLAAYVASLVGSLPSPYREAVTLTELGGRTQREAAEMMGVPLSTMKTRVQRGRARLRAMLDACCEIALDARNRPIECTPRAPGDCGCA